MKRCRMPITVVAVVLAACQPNAPEGDSVLADEGPRQYSATLAARVVVPFESRLRLPADVPVAMRLSGKFTHPEIPLLDVPGSYPAASFGSDPSAPRFTGVRFPIDGQPLQGFSGISAGPDGTFVVTLDNGFGSKSNSRDALLAFIRLRFRWETGDVDILEESILHDPDRILPFAIVNDSTEKRYLTGGDLDPESVQVVGSSVFIGEEFGPFLLRANFDGRITAFYEATMGDDTLRSKSDNPLPSPANVRRLHAGSKGFEGMALSSDERYLYLMLEGPIVDPVTNEPESVNDSSVLRILVFDVEQQRFTDNNYRYLPEQTGNLIGDFNFINEHEALVIERGPGEGDARLACGDEVTPDCFNNPARFKRVYRVSFEGLQSGDAVRKLGYIDLLDIQDGDERFTFPFVTIESVIRADETHLIVANDNNYGFSVGRTFGRNDDNEIILVEAPGFLGATR